MIAEPARVNELLPGRLLPEILEAVQDRTHLRVFDLGFGVPETIEFFADRRCTLYFGGLHDALKTARQPRPAEEAMDEDAWRALFRQAMPFGDDVRMDVCLFWDFLSYLDDMPLRVFIETLAPYVGESTRAYGYALLKDDTSVLDRSYSIVDEAQLMVRSAGLGQLRAYPRPQARLAALMKGFTINRSVLRRDGLLEMAVHAG